MPDIRLVRPRNSHVWLWSGLTAAAAILVWIGSTFFFGDATAAGPGKKVGARAGFGAERSAVLPLRTESFAQALPLEDRELGRLLRFTGTAESGVRRGALWVRSPTNHRIMVRFQPLPEDSALLRRIYPGAQVRLDGYLQKIALAEFEAWMDSLGVIIPRPAPGVKFGDLPDSSFARVDSLFIKNYYLSVRPQGIGAQTPGVAATTAPAAPPAGTLPGTARPAPSADTARRTEAPVTTPEEPRPDTAAAPPPGGVIP